MHHINHVRVSNTTINHLSKVIVFGMTMTKFQKKWENNVGGETDDDGNDIPAKTFSFVMQ